MSGNIIDFAVSKVYLRDRKQIFRLFDALLPAFIKSITNEKGAIVVDMVEFCTITKLVNLVDSEEYDLRDKVVYKKLVIFALEYLGKNTEVLYMSDIHELYQMLIFADLVLEDDVWYLTYE